MDMIDYYCYIIGGMKVTITIHIHTHSHAFLPTDISVTTVIIIITIKIKKKKEISFDFSSSDRLEKSNDCATDERLMNIDWRFGIRHNG